MIIGMMAGRLGFNRALLVGMSGIIRSTFVRTRYIADNERHRTDGFSVTFARTTAARPNPRALKGTGGRGETARGARTSSSGRAAVPPRRSRGCSRRTARGLRAGGVSGKFGREPCGGWPSWRRRIGRESAAGARTAAAHAEAGAAVDGLAGLGNRI
jgi:hypothetical protein